MSALAATRRALLAPATTLWGYLRHELLFLSFAAMETALLTPVVLVILGWAPYWPAGLVLLWLLLLMLLPLNLVRLMSLLHVGLRRQRWALMAALFLAVVLSWRQLLYTPSGLFDLSWLRQFAANVADTGSLVWARDLSLFVMTVFVWWRGVRLAIRQPNILNVGLRLRLGGLIGAPLVVWFSNRFLNTSVVPFLMMFFLAALLAVALVRAEEIEQEQRGTAATLNARWFGVVATAALAVALLGGIGAAILSGDSLLAVLSWLSPLWAALLFGATVVGSLLFEFSYPLLRLLALVVTALSQLLVGFFNQVAATLAGLGFDLPTAPETPATPEPSSPLGVLAGRSVTGLVMLGLIVLVGLALARVYLRSTVAARGSAPSHTARPTEERPSLGQRLLERLGLLRGWRAAASIRRIYRLMCGAAAAAGYPRLETETPYEYLPTLSRVWPDFGPEARLITESYIRVRYGELPETAAELEQIRDAWRRLEAAEPQRRDRPPDTPATLTKRE